MIAAKLSPEGRVRARTLSVAVACIATIVTWSSAGSVPAGAASVPTWTGVTAPIPSGGDATQISSSDAATCAAPGSCVSVGEYYKAGISLLDADTLANGHWTSVGVPLPPGALSSYQPYFRSIKCPSPTWCTAFGYYEDSAAAGQTFASTLSGGTWTTTELPLPPAFANPSVDTTNDGLACPAVGFCVAIGAYETPTSGQYATFIDTLSGGAWTTQQAPVPPGTPANPGAGLQAVSCFSSTACAAVGTYRTPNQAGLLDSLSGTTWSAAMAPEPSDAAANPNPGFFGVSCPSAAGCVAVGNYNATDTYAQNVVEMQSGGQWTALNVPAPADALTVAGGGKTPSAGFDDVSCPTVQWCVAVGGYVPTSTAQYAPETAVFTGGSWTIRAAPGLAPTDNTGYLGYVSCSWPGSCVATGTVSSDGGFTSRILVDTLTAGTWTGNDVAYPAGGNPNGLSFVDAPSCVAGTCLVGASYSTSTNYLGMFDTFSNLDGYTESASDGGIFAFNAPFFGSMGGQSLNQPVVGMAVEPDNGGTYEVASDGGIFAFNAPFFGSMGGQPLNKPIVGIAFDSRTGGYYEVASDGGIFAFNAPYQGSMGGTPLNSPIVGIAFDTLTGGYYEVASDGGVFAFNAPYQGSMGGTPLNKPIVGIAYDPATGGYYEVASDGGIFAFNAPYQGSMGGTPLNKPIVGMTVDYATGGYYEVASDGGLFAFDAPFQGSMGSSPLNSPIVAMAFG